MRHPKTFLLTLTVFAAIGAYGYGIYHEAKPVFAAASISMPNIKLKDPNLPWPTYGESAIGAVGYGVLATHGQQTPIPTASTAKMMTVLSILKEKPLQPGQQGPILTLTQADVDSYNSYLAEDGSVVKVAVGEKITEYQAIEAMLLPSANNMADTLAKWAFGSVSAYATYANSYAKSIGLTDSTFSDASGFSPKTVSTAQDLLTLGEKSLQNPVLAQIVSERSATVPVAGWIPNVNWFLGNNGINGIKTGYTDQAGGVYMFSAPQTYSNGQTVTIVGVIMGAPSVFRVLDDSLPLLQAARNTFQVTTAIRAGQSVGGYTIPWGGTADAIAADTLQIVEWPNENVMPQVSLSALHSPITKGANIGTLTFSLFPDKKITLTTDAAIKAPTWHWRLLHLF